MAAQLRTIRSLLDEGLTHGDVRRLVGNGTARRVRRGVLAFGPPSADPYDAMAERCAAALLVLPPGTMACRGTAAALHRLTEPVSSAVPIDVLLPQGTRHDRIAGVRPHESRPASACTHGGVPATDLVRTVLDCAAVLPRNRAVALIDTAANALPSLLDELTPLAVPSLLPRRGRRLAARHVTEATGLAESPLETLTWLLFLDSGLPLPVQQATIRHRGRFVGRVDFLWPHQRLVVEVDGMGKYDDRREWQREKERQNALIAAGYVVLRFTWADVTQRPEAVLAQVRRALLRAAS